MAVHMDQNFSTLFGMQTNFQSTQTSVAHPAYVLWLTCALQYQAVAHPTYMLWPTNGPMAYRLRTTAPTTTHRVGSVQRRFLFWKGA